MWNYLRHLQEKPLPTRKAILYTSTVVLFCVIVLVWVVLLNVRNAYEFKTNTNNNLLSPIDDIKEVFSKIFEAVKNENPPIGGIGDYGMPSTTTEPLLKPLFMDEGDMGSTTSTTTEDAAGTL
jgi:hypothetical protein